MCNNETDNLFNIDRFSAKAIFIPDETSPLRK